MHFSEIPGQEVLKRRLHQVNSSKRQPHASLFTGPEGNAALPLALATARRHLCHRPKPQKPQEAQKAHKEACGACPSCTSFDTLLHPDLHFFFPSVKFGTSASQQESAQSEYQKAWRAFIQAHPYGSPQRWRHFLLQHPILAASAQKNLLIGRDEVRRLLATVALTPYMSASTIIFIWAPERLHRIAANALLKTLEEPQSHTLFLLVSHAPQALLPTLRSRLATFCVPPFNVAEISGYLQKQGQAPAPSKAISAQSEGNMDEALTLSEQKATTHAPLLQEWLRSCWLNNAKRLIEATEAFSKQSLLEKQAFLRESLRLFRQVLLQKANYRAQSDSSDPNHRDFVQNFSKVISYDMLDSLNTLSNSMLGHLEQHTHPKMMFLAQSLRLAADFNRLRKQSL